MADPFDSSRRKIVRAKEHIRDLERQSKFFWDAHHYGVVIEPDPQRSDYEIHKIRFTEPLPESFSNITADAIHNLRSSLDNAGYGLAIAAGKVNPRHTAFPFAGSAIEFDNSLKGRCKDIPEEIYPLFRAYQPYKGGNDFLWALNETSITDKHKLLAVRLGSVLGDVLMTSGGLVRLHINPPWDSLKQEIEFGTFVAGTNIKYKMDFSLFLAFDEIPIVGGEPTLTVLNYFVSIVEHILSALEAEARRLGIVI